GECIAGVAVFKSSNSALAVTCKDMVKSAGLHVSPIHCDIILAGLKSLTHRMSVVQERMGEALEYLLQSQKVDIVLHPSLKSHPAHFNYINMLKLASNATASTKLEKIMVPGVVWFHVSTVVAPEVSRRWPPQWKMKIESCANDSELLYRTSYGHKSDLIDPWPKKDKTGVWIRLAIGFQKSELKERLSRLINLICERLPLCN
ncbi:Monoglyceride lipase, partial [Nowakowskiella sp. JEL0078]